MPDRAENSTQSTAEVLIDVAPEAVGPPAPRADVTSARRRVRPWMWVVLVVVAALAIIAAFGGFSAVPIERLPAVGIGEPVLGVQVDTTIDAAYLTSTDPYGGDSVAEDVEYIVAVATLVNHAEVPAFSVEDRIRIAVTGDVNGDDEPTIVIETRNRRYPSTLQPGVPMEVAYFWELPPGEVDPGTRAGVGVLDSFPIDDHPIFGDTAFSDPRAVAQTFIDLERR